MSVHPQAAVGFQRTAAAYRRGRPGYPDEVIAALVHRLGLGPGVTVLDVAAGTGKLTERLHESGARVLAVEPVAAMREQLTRRLPEMTVLDGRAEALPLDGPVDAITVAQAFHWFDGPGALSEFHRVLRPGGRLALLWNVRDSDQPLWRALEAILDPYRGQTPQHADARWRQSVAASKLFRADGVLRAPHPQTTDRQGVVDRILSTSFIAALPDRQRAHVLDAVRTLAAREPEPVVLRYVTELYWLERV